MATTTADAFNEFYEKIVPTEVQSRRVQDRANRWGDYLRKFFGPDHDMPVDGSRRT